MTRDTFQSPQKEAGCSCVQVCGLRDCFSLGARGELSSGGHGGQLSSVASWSFINFILASLCWSLTPQGHASPALPGCPRRIHRTSVRACSQESDPGHSSVGLLCQPSVTGTVNTQLQVPSFVGFSPSSFWG